MAAQPRIALIGTGMIAGAHLRAARSLGAEITGILGSRPERSAQVAREWRIPTGYADLAALIAERPDVVHVCTPNKSHAFYAEALIRAGIHTVVEKPVATTLADAELLADLAAKNDVVVTVPYVYRYHPLVREIRARRIAGEFGDIALVHGSYLQDWLLSPDAATWRVNPVEGGPSRAFADIGTHWCDLAEFVSGEKFLRLSAITSITHPTRPRHSTASFGGAVSSGNQQAEYVPVHTEDIAVVTFETARNIPATTVISQVSAGRKNRLWLEIDGTAGSAVFDQENPETIWLGRENESVLLHRGEAGAQPEQARFNQVPAGHPQGWTDAFTAFIHDTYRAVSGDVPDGLPTIEDGLRSVRLIDAVLSSAGSREWVSI
ncbi:Gfo/Idh/MocA family oxidoreductase [Corynebacterium hylobatis]|uniref:Gfo/Idh/MocA family oxidoreductase n=1 Tax=Corynebacterium hylobatis TaxID=1859290 RepID=A0A3R9ZFF7_9CORY|nr:Gfo/Idh/MocA family oxidoreductase [Corynebacterium hylobatis]RSZ66039.1 Gfo/Idh/MocA family oxidoreductase [Corynebacterium hylobatis]